MTTPANEEWRVGDWAEKHFDLKDWATLDRSERQKWLYAYDDIKALSDDELQYIASEHAAEVNDLEGQLEDLKEKIDELVYELEKLGKELEEEHGKE